jgi:WD40 repeat protein
MVVHAAAISPDNQLLAAAGVDARVTLWDLQKGTLIKAFSGALNAYNCVAISRDGQRVFAGGSPSTLSVWDTGSLQSVGTFKGHGEVMRGLAILGGSDTVIVNEHSEARMRGLAILGGSDTVVSVGSGALRLWRAPSFAEIEAAEERLKSGQSR